MKTVIVIGGGVAGFQAGSFTAKAGEETLVLDSGQSLVLNTANIQNLIGHDSISGSELLKKGKDKLEEFNGEFKEEEVQKVERTGEGLKVTTSEEEYNTKYIIVASAGMHDYLEELDLDFVEGRDDPYLMDEHIDTDEDNKAAERVYAAGLARYWIHQTSFAIGDGTKAATNLLSDKYGEPYQDHDT